MDPIFSHGVDFVAALTIVVKVLVAFVLLLVSVLMMIWFERKVISDMQNRIGPDRAGPWGILQSVADGVKLFFKEDLLPDRADRRMFRLAPYLSSVPAFIMFTVVPLGGVIHFGHRSTQLQVADPPIGILLVLAASAVAVYGVLLAGWSSGSKYPLLGGVRASAQLISYEAALGLSVAAAVLITGSLSTRDIVDAQNGVIRGFIPNWNVFRLGFVPFLVFLLASTAEMNRPPFDLVEAEQELVGGFHTEYSSVRFALFFLAEFMGTITMSAIAVTLFLGGPDGPGFHFVRWLWPILWFAGKTIVLLFVQVWLRGTLPRLRYDQLMGFGWKFLIPISLGWLMVVGAMRVSLGWGLVVVAIGILFGVMLVRAMTISGRRVGEVFN